MKPKKEDSGFRRPSLCVCLSHEWLLTGTLGSETHWERAVLRSLAHLPLNGGGADPGLPAPPVCKMALALDVCSSWSPASLNVFTNVTPRRSLQSRVYSSMVSPLPTPPVSCYLQKLHLCSTHGKSKTFAPRGGVALLGCVLRLLYQ